MEYSIFEVVWNEHGKSKAFFHKSENAWKLKDELELDGFMVNINCYNFLD